MKIAVVTTFNQKLYDYYAHRFMKTYNWPFDLYVYHEGWHPKQQEKRWATYLFSQGSMIGLSEKLLHQFVEYMANRRMKAIGLTPVYDQKSNPLPWIDHWLNSKGTQNAPQETEIESYVIGGIKQDVKKDQFKKFKL